MSLFYNLGVFMAFGRVGGDLSPSIDEKGIRPGLEISGTGGTWRMAMRTRRFLPEEELHSEMLGLGESRPAS